MLHGQTPGNSCPSCRSGRQHGGIAWPPTRNVRPDSGPCRAFCHTSRCLAAFERRNDRLRSQCSNVSTNAVAVVPFVGDDGFGTMLAQQRTSMSGVRFLACSQLQDHGNATCIDRYVQLAAEATSRAPQCLFRLPAGLVFLAPAACTWARTIVVSRINWSKSGSPPNACETRAQTPD